ncbi:hypothetical protein [Blastopirellula marina]|uniref:Uncharacterized protein n=1 Tax=Blastopirellula marina TaxID=124 RepID=A0A2S8FD11_9BACT|nr:hypothetical protein [Blastopirellula marina]PQO30061.1 hypothetical protein C5Y98_21115 [Blastopirellula marina]PTL42499.1 hypothetical protein C5Y97_21125 [Blastopirellula marina]
MLLLVRTFLFTIVLVAAAAVPARAGEWTQQRHDVAEIEASLGFGGRFKVGVWSPIRVTLTAGQQPINGAIHIASFDSDGVPVEHRWAADEPAAIDAGESKTFVLPVKIGRTNSRIEVILESEADGVVSRSIWNANIAELGQPVLASQQLWLSAGDLDGIDDVLRMQRVQPSEQTQHASITPDQIPDDWRMLEGVDRLLIVSGQADAWTQLSAEQLAALDWWTKLGGKIFLAVGADSPQLLAAGAPLAPFLPGKFVRMEEESETGDLEKFAGKATRLDRPDAPPLTIAVLQDASGIAIVEHGGSSDPTPLISVAPYGFGLIEFVAFDLNAPPIAGWDGRQPLLDKLLIGESQQQQGGAVSLAGRSAAHVGYEDLSGQLRVALDQFQGVHLISFFLIGVIIVGYLLLIGPGDFFLLKRFFPRMEWTWVTFPAFVVLACVVSWGVAYWAKGTEMRMNQVDVLDCDLSSRVVRSTTWAHIYSPQTQRLDIQLHNQAPSQASDWRQILAWQGLPGKSLGGMDSRQSLATVQNPYYLAEADDSVQLENLPIQIWSSRSLFGRSWATLEGDAPKPLTEINNQLLDGVIRNPTDIDLEDVYVFYGRWAWQFQKFPAGGVLSLSGKAGKNSDKVLRKTRVADARDVSELWDRENTDIDRIMEVSLFHESAGGRGYTNLIQRYQGFIDLSEHTQTQRAVLVGKAVEPVTELQIRAAGSDEPLHPKTERWTYVRLIYPVEPE